MIVFSKILFYLSFILVFSSCVDLNGPEIVDFEIIDIDKDYSNNLILRTCVNIYNPSIFNFNTNELKINVFYDTILVARTFFGNQINILNKDTSNLNLDFEVNTNTIKYFTNSKDSVLLNIIGYIRTPFFNKKYFFNTNYTLSPISDISNFLIDKFDLRIAKINFLNASINEVNLDVGLAFNNLEEFNLSIDRLETFIYTDINYTDLLGVLELDTAALNSFENNRIVYSNVKLNAMKLTKLLFVNSLNRSNILYVKINSMVDFDGINIPISLNKEIHYNPLTFESQIR